MEGYIEPEQSESKILLKEIGEYLLNQIRDLENTEGQINGR